MRGKMTRPRMALTPITGSSTAVMKRSHEATEIRYGVHAFFSLLALRSTRIVNTFPKIPKNRDFFSISFIAFLFLTLTYHRKSEEKHAHDHFTFAGIEGEAVATLRAHTGWLNLYH